MLGKIPRLLWILVLGLVLRLINVNQSLWLDEATSILAASKLSYSAIIHQFSPGDFHPPAYYLLLKFWIGIFGSSEVTVRSLSVVFGVVTIYLVYSLTRKLFDNTTALIAALLLATAPLHIYYSQEARMYILETLLVVKIMQLVITIIMGKQRIFTWISLFAFSGLLLYTDYLPLAIFISIGLYLLIFENKVFRKYFFGWMGIFIGLVIVYLPWLPILKLQLAVGTVVKVNAPGWWEALGKTDFKQLTLVPLKFAIGRITSYNKILYYSLASIPVVLYAITISRSLFDWRKTSLIWLWLVVPLGAFAVLGLYLPIFSYFRFLFVLPAFYILAAVGAQSLGKLGRVLIALLVVCNLAASGIYLAAPRFQREDWKGAVEWIEINSQETSAASIFVTDGQRDPYYYYSKNVPSFGPSGIDLNFDKIWLMRYVQPIFDPEDTVRNQVETVGYKKVAERDFNGVTVWEYIR
ncbi:MAG: Uncharacterized protein G01um10145_168 [Microgenomates group bacterium Gr01-1014_5]|nr:MAG: Uncharacterized protein G01um10145_168 [Microgenomates group bacterium Gr01-1014_5]